jgi:hypothetical protein
MGNLVILWCLVSIHTNVHNIRKGNMAYIGQIVKVLTHSIQTGKYDRMTLEEDSDYSIGMSRFINNKALDEVKKLARAKTTTSSNQICQTSSPQEAAQISSTETEMSSLQ